MVEEKQKQTKSAAKESAAQRNASERHGRTKEFRPSDPTNNENSKHNTALLKTTNVELVVTTTIAGLVGLFGGFHLRLSGPRLFQDHLWLNFGVLPLLSMFLIFSINYLRLKDKIET